MIQFQQISKRYNEAIALEGVHFSVGASEMVFLTGHSGAGKTTVLKLILGLTAPSSGTLIVEGCDVSQLPESTVPIYRRHIGVITQSPLLLHDRSVFHNVELPLLIRGARGIDVERRVRGALDKVGLLHKENALPSALSAGERQRVSIARALVTKPKVLLADEPTGNLDPGLSAEVMNLFEAFRQVGMSILVATHDLALIAQMKYRIMTLSHGRLIDDGAG
jgi:cell division transport system ATP-binding protein